MPGPKNKQRATAEPRKEKSLDGFIPTSYMALLEGTLLTNGDIKVTAFDGATVASCCFLRQMGFPYRYLVRDLARRRPLVLRALGVMLPLSFPVHSESGFHVCSNRM